MIAGFCLFSVGFVFAGGIAFGLGYHGSGLVLGAWGAGWLGIIYSVATRKVA